MGHASALRSCYFRHSIQSGYKGAMPTIRTMPPRTTCIAGDECFVRKVQQHLPGGRCERGSWGNERPRRWRGDCGQTPTIDASCKNINVSTGSPPRLACFRRFYHRDRRKATRCQTSSRITLESPREHLRGRRPRPRVFVVTHVR